MDVLMMNFKDYEKFHEIRKMDSRTKSLEDDKEVSHKSSHEIAAKNSQKHTLLDKIRELPAKANLISKNFQLWARKRKNLGFYKKYLDRVNSGLYEKYASTAQVKENIMLDDPVTILKDRAKVYIHDIVEGINKVYKNVLDLSKSLEGELDPKKCMQLCDNYIGKDIISQNIKGEKSEDKSYKIKLLDATKMKIAKVLMENGNRRVYGYTVKSMVLKGYPTPNHLIVTLFVDNPELNPEEQSVNEIFKSSESFDIIGDSDKQDIFNTSNMTNAALNKTVDNKVMNTIQMYKANTLNRFKSSALDDKKEKAKIIDQIWDGVKLSSRELLSKKAYIIDCINIYYQMILRIDDLAVKAIKSMLVQESMNLDKRYKNQLKVGQMSNREVRKSGFDNQADDEREERRANNRNIADIAKRLNSGKRSAVLMH